MRVSASTSAHVSDPASDPFLETFKLVLLIKYASWVGVILFELSIDVYEGGLAALWAELSTLLTWSYLTSIPVVVALVLWIGSDRITYGLSVMTAIGVDALVKTVRMGPYFLNHYFLQIVLAVLGVLAVARLASGNRARDAFKPLAWSAILLWGAAGSKKFLHGTFVSGEYIASTVGSNRDAPIGWLTDFLLARDGQAIVPVRCCVAGAIDVSAAGAALVVLIGIAMALGELLPVGFVLWRRMRPAVGWVMLATTVVATALTNEPDFGLTNVAFVTLWARTRALRRACVGLALMMAGAHLWLLLT